MKLNILLAEVSQGFSQISVTLNELDEEASTEVMYSQQIACCPHIQLACILDAHKVCMPHQDQNTACF